MTILKHFTSRLALLLPFLLFALTVNSQNSQKEYYEIKTYRLKDKSRKREYMLFSLTIFYLLLISLELKKSVSLFRLKQIQHLASVLLYLYLIHHSNNSRN